MTRSADAGAGDAVVRIERVSRTFGETRAVDDVSIDVLRGELLVLLGPSGCGKTTTLRMIAGFEQPDSGRIQIEGRDVTGEPPRQRSTGMVFQNYALFPHLDVFENVAFGLKARGAARAEIAERVREVLALVDLDGYATRRVQALSGGQQQRVALARALAPRPPVLLLDEPLSNLDAALRERTRTELRALLHRLDMTAVFVTHDQEEAFALADRIAVMRAGRVEQIGTPERLYREPVSEFVAGFLGRANFLEATVVRVDPGDGSALCSLDAWDARWWAGARPDGTVRTGEAVRFMARPEDLELTPSPERDVGVPRAIRGDADIGPVGATEAPPAGDSDDTSAIARVVGKHFVGSSVRYVLEPFVAEGAARPPRARGEAPTAPILASGRELGFELGDVVSIAPRMDASVRWFAAAPEGAGVTPEPGLA
ncbi:MAG TPA: ABC transporter ATP-binding protein [Longimicrobiales bacterium]|nr:ABC transporter ATP-binding protein [Longimicrobiales bacterium]